MSILTLTQVKEHIRVESDSVDTLIQAYIDGVEDWTQRYLNVSFSQTAVTDEPCAGGTNVLLPYIKCPITTGETVTVKDAYADNEVVDADTYMVWDRGITRKEGLVWGRGDWRWLVSYTGGYANAAAVPAVIKSSMLVLVGRAYEQRKGEMSQSDTGMSLSWGTIADSVVTEMIAPYRHGSLI